MTSAIEHIRKARAELSDERARIDEEIAVLDDVIRRLGGERPASGVPAAGVTIYHSRSVRDIALEVAASGKLFSLQDVVNAAKNEGSPAKYESISSVLSRLGKEGVFTKGPRRGTYVLTKPEAPAEAEASVPEDGSSAATDVPRQEGATDDLGDHRDSPPLGDQFGDQSPRACDSRGLAPICGPRPVSGPGLELAPGGFNSLVVHGSC